MPKEITQIYSFEIKNIFEEFKQLVLKMAEYNKKELIEIIMKWLEQKKFKPEKRKLLLSCLIRYACDKNFKDAIETIIAIKVYDDSTFIALLKNGKEEKYKTKNNFSFKL